MQLNRIKINGFRNFEGEHEFVIMGRNLINGPNGCGKTTLALDSFLFAIYGYSDCALEKLPTRWAKKKECSVTVYVDDYIIERQYPTKINISLKGEELQFANSKEAQKYLNSIFKDVNYFRQFRMLDVVKGVNILESGKTALMKTLFGFHEEFVNKIRRTLLEKKKVYEIYNKDKAVVFKHHPSKYRYDTIDMGILDLTEQYYNMEKDIRSATVGLNNIMQKKAMKTNSKSMFTKRKYDTMSSGACPTCNRKVSEEEKEKLLSEFNSNIKALNRSLEIIDSDETENKDLVSYLKNLKDSLMEKKNRLIALRVKLETRIKQKEYKWTNRDVEIIKKSVKELDDFCAKYIADWVQILEPLINDIIEKIGFEIRFSIDEKGNLDLKLIKDKQEYTYKDLSSGQKLILTVAFQMALLIEKGETGLMIADEGFSSLDEQNLQYIFDLFKSTPFQLVCVIHRFEDVPESVNVIELGV